MMAPRLLFPCARSSDVARLALLLFFTLRISAQTNKDSQATNTNDQAVRSEQVRAECVEGRRYICGKVLQITADGIVVDSGYAELLNPPLNRSWVVLGTAVVKRDGAAVEEKKPDAICIGLVFLTGTPKKPQVHEKNQTDRKSTRLNSSH